MRRWIFIAALGLLVGAPLFIFAVYLPQFITRQGAVDRSACRRNLASVQEPSGRLTIILLDGLGYADARALPELAAWHAQAVTRPVRVEFPTFTTPALVAFTTGLGPRDSGVRLNGDVADAIADLDSLAHVAAHAGRPLRVFDGGWDSFAPIVRAEQGVLVSGVEAMEGSATAPAHPLDLVYFEDVDDQGHRHGADSDEYRAAARRGAALVERHRQRLGPRDVLVVLSDHGHRPDGGHGGLEPGVPLAYFALASPDAIAAGELGERPLVDVAPTLAALAGLAPPACAYGTPMLDMLRPELRAPLLVPSYLQTSQLLCDGQCEGTEEDTAERLVAGEDWERADAALRAAARERTQSLDASVQRMRLARLAVALVLALVVVLRWRRFGWPALRGWSPLWTLWSGYGAVLFIRGYRLTFSKMPGRDDFLPDAALAAAVALALCIAAWLWARRGGVDRVRAALALLVGSLLPYLLLAAYVGVDHTAVVPPRLGLLVILASPALIGCALAVMVLLLVAPASTPAPAKVSGTGGDEIDAGEELGAE